MAFIKTVLIIFGGRSSEYDVSLNSAASVIKNIPKEKYNILTLGITREGAWHLFEGDYSLIAEDKWHTGGLCVPAIISPDAGERGLLVFRESGTERLAFDAVFPALHGRNGEDGAMQGLFELAGVAYVGSGLISSALCMDKVFANTLADSLGIRQAKWLSIKQREYAENGEEFLDAAVKELGFPIFVKPANTGSSIGISKAKDMPGLRQAVPEAFKYDDKILLEEGIDGREMECAVLGNLEPVASIVGEVIPCNEFYDYAAKYIDDASELIVPADIPEEVSDEIRASALKIFKSLGCTGLSRVDFFVRNSNGMIYFNEINTLPGFTPISMYPKLFAGYGISYSDLIDRLIQLSLEREAVV